MFRDKMLNRNTLTALLVDTVGLTSIIKPVLFSSRSDVRVSVCFTRQLSNEMPFELAIGRDYWTRYCSLIFLSRSSSGRKGHMSKFKITRRQICSFSAESVNEMGKPVFSKLEEKRRMENVHRPITIHCESKKQDT